MASLGIGRRGGAPYWGVALETGSKVAVMGDSIIQLGMIGSASDVNITARSGIGWARALDPRFSHVNSWVPSGTDARFFTGHNHGISGETTTQMVSRFAALMAMNPDIVGVSGGTNDVAAGTASGTITGNLDTMITTALAANKRVFLTTIRPRATTGASSIPVGDAKWAILHAVNTWILGQNRPRLTVINLTPWLTDGVTDVSGNGSGWFYKAKPEYLGDNVHLSHLGGYQEGKALAAYLSGQITAGNIWPTDPFAAGNGIPLAGMLGTSGTTNTETNFTGQIATGWQLRGYTVSGGAVAGSKEVISGTLEKQVLTFSAGTSSGAYENHAIRPNPDMITLASLGWAIGDWVQAGFFVEVGAWDRWQHFQARINFVNSGGTAIFFARMFPFLTGTLPDLSTGPMPYPSEAWSGWIVTPPTQIPATIDRLAPALEVQAALNGAAGSGTVKISRPWMRKVTAPVYT